MRTRRTSIAALVMPLAGVLLLAGCSGAGTAGGTSNSQGAAATTAATASSAQAPSKPVPSNPCALVSLAEASKAIGSTVSSTSRQGTNCTYNNEEHGFGLELYPHGGNDEWEDGIVGMKAQFDKAPAIAGLGDRAVGIGGHVFVQVGSTVIAVDDDFADKDPKLVRAIAVAKVALSHL